MLGEQPCSGRKQCSGSALGEPEDQQGVQSGYTIESNGKREGDEVREVNKEKMMKPSLVGHCKKVISYSE